MNEAQIADQIADLGASISVAASSERTLLRIRSLSRTDLREQVVQLASVILAKPSYDGKVLDREKQRLITALLEAQTKPETILQQNLCSFLFLQIQLLILENDFLEYQLLKILFLSHLVL